MRRMIQYQTIWQVSRPHKNVNFYEMQCNAACLVQ
jgi:hypothetical protein